MSSYEDMRELQREAMDKANAPPPVPAESEAMDTFASSDAEIAMREAKERIEDLETRLMEESEGSPGRENARLWERQCSAAEGDRDDARDQVRTLREDAVSLRSQLAERDEEIGKLKKEAELFSAATIDEECAISVWSKDRLRQAAVYWEEKCEAWERGSIAERNAFCAANASLEEANTLLEEENAALKASVLRLEEHERLKDAYSNRDALDADVSKLVKLRSTVASLEERLSETLAGKTRLEGSFHAIGKYVEEHGLHRYVTVRYGGDTDVLQIIRGLHRALGAEEES